MGRGTRAGERLTVGREVLLVDVHLVFSDDVVTLLQTVHGIPFSYALLDEDAVGGVYVNSLLAGSDDSVLIASRIPLVLTVRSAEPARLITFFGLM